MRVWSLHRLCALAATGAALVALAGCGDEDSAENQVSAAIPADAVFFGQVVVRPEGEDRERLEALLEPFLDSEGDGATLEERFDQLLAEEEAGITYEEDIEPWLGEHAGFWAADFGDAGLIAPEDEPDDGAYSFAVEVTDEEAATEFAQGSAESAEVEIEELSYEGVDLLIDEDNQGIAVTDGLLIGGTEKGLEASIDALAEGGLADEEVDADAEATMELEEGTIGAFYLDMAAIFDYAEAEGGIDPEEREAFDRIAPGFAEQPLTGALSLGDDSVALDLALGSFPAAFGSFAETPLLGELPAGSLAAFGGADLGEGYTRSLELLSELSASEGPQLDRIYQGFEREAGFPLQDVLDAVGDVAVFVRGTSPFDLDGAGVIETRDPQLTQTLLGRLQRLIAREGQARLGPAPPGSDAGFSVASPDLPQPIEVVQRDDRVVIGYGSAATEDALEPEDTLADSEPFESARAGFGDEQGLAAFVDLTGAVELASVGAAFSPELSSAMPYLERLTYLAYGGSVDDDRSRYRIVVGYE